MFGPVYIIMSSAAELMLQHLVKHNGRAFLKRQSSKPVHLCPLVNGDSPVLKGGRRLEVDKPFAQVERMVDG